MTSKYDVSKDISVTFTNALLSNILLQAVPNEFINSVDECSPHGRLFVKIVMSYLGKRRLLFAKQNHAFKINVTIAGTNPPS